LRPSLRARQIPNSDMGKSFEQMGQSFTWGEDCISIIFTQLRWALRLGFNP